MWISWRSEVKKRIPNAL
jgi:hypothetical protein